MAKVSKPKNEKVRNDEYKQPLKIDNSTKGAEDKRTDLEKKVDKANQKNKI